MLTEETRWFYQAGQEAFCIYVLFIQDEPSHIKLDFYKTKYGLENHLCFPLEIRMKLFFMIQSTVCGLAELTWASFDQVSCPMLLPLIKQVPILYLLAADNFILYYYHSKKR